MTIKAKKSYTGHLNSQRGIYLPRGLSCSNSNPFEAPARKYAPDPNAGVNHHLFTAQFNSLVRALELQCCERGVVVTVVSGFIAPISPASLLSPRLTLLFSITPALQELYRTIHTQTVRHDLHKTLGKAIQKT
jgi:hypothetical protein